MAKIPQWAQDLTIRVALDEGREDLPDVKWRRGSGEFSGGHTKYDSREVVVTAGRSRRDQKLVLIHELAHWLTPNEWHSGAYWDVAWRLFRRYKVPILYARQRSGIYRKGALAAYRRSRRNAE